MLIASRPNGVLAGLFGGSGNHLIQITIGIILVVGLIGYFVWRLASRGGGRFGDARAVVSRRESDRHNTDPDDSSDGTVRLGRTWTAIIGAPNEQWNIAIDGIVVGTIARDETVDVAVEPGHHALRLGSGRHRSPERSFDVARDEVIGFNCHGPRIWPLLLAALVNPNLWISLRPS
jgi:hypothetical protein